MIMMTHMIIENWWFYWCFNNWTWLRSWSLDFSSKTVSESDQMLHCKVMSTIGKKNNTRDKTFLILHAWRLLGPLCLEKWIRDLVIQVNREMDILTNELCLANWLEHQTNLAIEKLIRTLIYTSHLPI